MTQINVSSRASAAVSRGEPSSASISPKISPGSRISNVTSLPLAPVLASLTLPCLSKYTLLLGSPGRRAAFLYVGDVVPPEEPFDDDVHDHAHAVAGGNDEAS